MKPNIQKGFNLREHVDHTFSFRNLKFLVQPYDLIWVWIARGKMEQKAADFLVL